MRHLNQIDSVRSAAAAALIAELLHDCVLARFLQSQTLKVDGAGTLRLGPVEHREHGLALTFLQQKDARLLVVRRIGHQIHRRGGAAETGHVEQIRVLQQGQAFRRGAEGGKIVSDLEHAP